MTGMSSLLNVADLRVEFTLPANVRIRALRGVHLQIEPGICYGILGESGSGKSTLAKALIQLLPKNAKVLSGRTDSGGRIFRNSPMRNSSVTTERTSPSSRSNQDSHLTP